MRGDFDHTIVESTAHRPWPMPRVPSLMTRSWHDLLLPTGASMCRKCVARFRRPSTSISSTVGLAGGRAVLHDEYWSSGDTSDAMDFSFRRTQCSDAFEWRIGPASTFQPRCRPLAGGRGGAQASRSALLTADMTIERHRDGLGYERRVERASPRSSRRCTTNGAPFVAVRRFDRELPHERYCLYHQNRLGIRTASTFTTGRGSPVARAAITMNTMAAATHLTLNGAPALLHFHGVKT